MIHFSCGGCGRHVRVADSFGGKKGRCPFCKAVVQIPESRAASGASSSVPPPPESIEPPAAGDEPDLDMLAAGDPRHRTDRLEALLEGAVAETDAAEAASTLGGSYKSAQAAAAGGPKQKLSPQVLIIAGGSVLVAIVVAALYFGDMLGSDSPQRARPRATAGPVRQPPRQQPQPQPRPVASPAQPSPVPEPLPPTPGPAARPQPGPAPQPGPVPQPGPSGVPGMSGMGYPLDEKVATAADAAPDAAFCMLYVDFAGLARGLSKLPRGTAGIASTIAASKFWQGLTERVAEGAMPESGTLFLVGRFVTVPVVFGPFHGLMPGSAARNPAGGLWSLVRPNSEIPDFMVRLTGAGAKRCSALLLRRAILVTGGAFQLGAVATHERLRLVPSGMLKDKAMLLGSIHTIRDSGQPATNHKHVQRLRDLLGKVQTHKAAVAGCVLLRGSESVNSALSVKGPQLSVVGSAAVLVFALDPGGTGTVVICRVPPTAADEVNALATGMTTVPDAMKMEIHVTGSGAAAMDLLAKLMPGLRKLVIEAVNRAGPVPSLASSPLPQLPTPTGKPRPQPQPQPQPQPDQPKPQPQPGEPSQPPASDALPFVCMNPQCPSGGQKFDVPKSELPGGFVPFAPIKCPKCGRLSAAAAIRCEHCGKWMPLMSPQCPHCKKRRQ